MKKFLIKIALFIFPLIIGGISIEYYAQNKTTFSIKKKFLESNLTSTEVLILGSSHSQNAINPRYLKSRKCANIAFGGQPIAIDYFLLEKYIDKMANLKIVVFEISSHRFFEDLNLSTWNAHIYSNLYDIDYKVEKFSIKNFSLLFSDPRFFSDIFIDYINPNSYKYKLNKYGFVENDFNDRFLKLKYDSIKINNSYTRQYDFKQTKYNSINEEFVIKTIEKCRKRGIKIIFITTPVYKTFSSKIPNKIAKYTNSLTNKLCAKYHIDYYNFLTNKKFKVNDFKNDNHLNSDGAKKFTFIMDSLIVVNGKNLKSQER